MIKKAEASRSYNRCIVVAGFENVKIEDINGFLEHVRKEVREVHIQFFDADTIASRDHVFFAALNALKAFERKAKISNSLAVEALLYASAQRQIKKAVSMLGIKEDSSQVVVLVIAERCQGIGDCLKLFSTLTSGERNDDVVKLEDGKIENIKKLFGISDLEIEAKSRIKGLEWEAIVDLVIERVALLATQS